MIFNLIMFLSLCLGMFCLYILERDLEELGTQIDELEKKEITKSGKRWRGVKGRFYWYIESDCEVYGEYEKDEDYDNARYEIGNYFRIKEEAEKILEKIKIYMQLKDFALQLNKGREIDWEDNEQEKYYIYYDRETMKLDYNSSWTYQNIGQICCLDKQFLNKAKCEIGEENLKKLFE